MDKVLIVDEDKKFLDRLSRNLQKYVGQIEIVTALDSGRAVEVLDKERISVLVADLETAQTNESELLAYIRKFRPQTPWIAMTDSPGSDRPDGTTLDSAFRFISKPFSADELFALIMEGLERLDEGLFWREGRRP